MDGRIVLALNEDRLTRRKHESGFPAQALAAGLEFCKLDDGPPPALVVLNQHPPADYKHQLLAFFPNFDLDRLHINPSHHLLHACYAGAASGFLHSAVLIIDGSGYSYAEYKRRQRSHLTPSAQDPEAHEAWSLFELREGRLTSVARGWELWVDDNENRYRFPSLGHMYSLAAQVIFGAWTSAGKVMGLAAYGDKERLDFPIVTTTEDDINIDVDWIFNIEEPLACSQHAEQDPLARDIAAKVQSELEKGVFHLSRMARERTGASNLCLSGGVALNTVCNAKVRANAGFDDIFVTPAAQDSGVAIGAAAFGFMMLHGHLPDFSDTLEFLGLDHKREEVLPELETRADVDYSQPEDVVSACLEDLLAGKTVGWSESRAEFGPRALGHRSILADPRVPDMKHRVNEKVKFREAFRPFAASILQEQTKRFFEGKDTNPHMLFVADSKPGVLDAVPSVVHVDGSCRLQTVAADFPGTLRLILESFYEATGVPLLLNTSLNLAGEPLCDHPRDSVRTLVHSGLDVLYLEGLRVVKAGREEQRLEERVPVLAESLRLVHKAAHEPRVGRLRIKERQLEIGRAPLVRQLVISQFQEQVLRLIDAQRRVADIAEMLTGDGERVADALIQLNDAGAIYFAGGSAASLDDGTPPRVVS